MGLTFYDLDHEIEIFFNTSIERLQARFLTPHSYRDEAAKALLHLLVRTESQNSLIALPPSGLMGRYLRAVERFGGLVVALWDEPKNILDRITFYAIDSRPMERRMTAGEKSLHLREIQKDMTCLGKTYERAHLRVDIAGLDVEAAARRVKESVEVCGGEAATGTESGESEQRHPADGSTKGSGAGDRPVAAAADAERLPKENDMR